MARLDGELWKWNLAKVVVVDVTDDYRLMQPPLPCECYPILCETLLPRHNLAKSLLDRGLVNGYLYDWHESPPVEGGAWYVGVVSEDLAGDLAEPS